MKRILFRADAKPSIGIGDLMSLINLSYYFDPNEWECFFMVRPYPAGLKLIKRVEEDKVFVLSEGITIQDEVDKINRIVKTYDIDLLFFEITEIALSEYQGLTKEVKKACINFNSHLLNDLSLVINWDVEAVQYMHQQDAPKATFLLGPEYVILPKHFYTLKNRKHSEIVETLLIAMGGADEFDFTLQIVNVLIEKKCDLKLNIIIGSGYENRDELEIKLRNSQLKFEIKQDVSDMLNEYLACDLAIGAGGLTASELVASKTPALLIATYEHQIARCQFFDERGFVQYLGFKSFDSKTLLDALKAPKKMQENTFFNTQKIIDQVASLV